MAGRNNMPVMPQIHKIRNNIVCLNSSTIHPEISQGAMIMSLSPAAVSRLPHVVGVLNYLAPMAEKPRNYTYEPPPGVAQSNAVYEPHELPIFDARSVAAHLSLDEEGLALVE